MNNKLFLKLACNNIKKNKRIYLPYLISSLFAVVTFFTITMMQKSDSLLNIGGGNYLVIVLGFGIYVIGIFSVIFIFFTNGFLIKQRKKELGLYTILGLEKRHIGIVLFYETIFTFLITVGGGLIIGTAISKLIFLILLNLVRFDISIQLDYSVSAYVVTIVLFACIYLSALIKNILQVQLVNPINLLKGTNQGEKEPKASWIFALLGVILLGAGYYIAITIKNPLEAFFYFFIAVILVIIGTHLTFASASIYILKFMKKRKRFYYRPKNFISVSGMIYRMKQNAAGLANVCILSTMVIICLCSVFSLYIGQSDVMKQLYNRDIFTSFKMEQVSTEQIEQIYEKTQQKYEVNPTFFGMYRGIGGNVVFKDGELSSSEELKANFGINDIQDVVDVCFVPVEDFNAFTGENYTLAENEILAFDTADKYKKDSLIIAGNNYVVNQTLESFNKIQKVDSDLERTLYIVVKDFDLAEQLTAALSEKDIKDIKSLGTYYYYMDIDGEELTKIQFETELRDNLKGTNALKRTMTLHTDNEEWYITYGGLLFIGVYFGILFLVATVLIIYYKQITEGFDDHERFNIMQKVGMSKLEVKKTIKKQILMVFGLPLLGAISHTYFALFMLRKLFQIFGLYNQTLINLCTAGTVFMYGIVYVIVYILTAKVYYKIVKY